MSSIILSSKTVSRLKRPVKCKAYPFKAKKYGHGQQPGKPNWKYEESKKLKQHSDSDDCVDTTGYMGRDRHGRPAGINPMYSKTGNGQNGETYISAKDWAHRTMRDRLPQGPGGNGIKKKQRITRHSRGGRC